ncbi:hypothetical protein B1A99_17355 [Cohnella sp. CIP 111063]|nr:hypothetical protein B1A99_17355 [Cohnella sp. CIP 111063]PRX70694.1 multiple sugar transport system substrate-binding protein [Cohnella sp. SGD-V74]
MLIAATALALIAGGCASKPDGGGEWKTFEQDEQASLKVMYWDEQSFHEDYGNLFKSYYPNVEFEVIGLPVGSDPSLTVTELYNRHIEENRPDILFVDKHRWLAEEGKLLELDPIIKRQEYDLSGYMPAVLAKLREEGDGKLYGLSPNFRSFGLYYNAALFEKYGIERPRDSMTWEEVFELAKRFPADGEGNDRVYGFALDGFSSPLTDIVYSLMAQNRKILNADGTAVGLEGDSWRGIFESIVSVVRSGSFYLPTPEETAKRTRFMEDDRFLMGRSAMTYRDHLYLRQLGNASVDWAVVSAPVEALNRTQSSAYDPGPAFVISRQSANPRAAWEFVKYANSGEFAQIKSKSSSDFLFSRTEYIRPPSERDVTGLYTLDPVANASDEFVALEPRLKVDLVQLIASELTAAAEGIKTLDAAIEAMREDGNVLLAQMKAARP